MSWIALALSPLIVLQSQPQSVPHAQQDQPSPEETARQVPIIVEGSRETELTQPTTGSRIRTENDRRPTGIATNTGISGLTPGSGMEPFHGTNPTRKLITTTCVSDNANIGERASCLFLQAQRDVDAGQWEGASDIYRYLVSSEEFSAEERLMGGTSLLNLASQIEDTDLREEAIIRLLESGVLPEANAPSARRNLAQMALARGNTALAIERLEEHLAISTDDAASFANLAILRRDAGQNDSVTPMQRAIELQETNGNDVPQGWRDFVRMENAG